MDQDQTRERLFKYTSALTATKILETSAVRYSSPLLFNDPFDIQSGLHFSFDITRLRERVAQRMKDLVASDAKPEVNEDDPWGQAIILMWKNKDRRTVPDSVLKLLVAPLTERIAHYQEQCQYIWSDVFLPRLRVFSATEDEDNILMWSHYAQNHTGVVFSFRVMQKEDNALRTAKPVIYKREPPPLFSEEEWINFILLENLDPSEFFVQYAFIKSAHWAYEKEWRVWTFEPEPKRELFTDYSLLPNEIEAVYLGCRMELEQKKIIKALLSTTFPEARLFQARRPRDEYRLIFAEI